MSEKMLAGIDRKIITPKLGARLYGYTDNIFCDSVNDDLHATAVYFEYKTKKFLMVVVEVCTVNTALSYSLREKISEITQIPVGNIVIPATHTHSGPCTSGMSGWGDVDEDYCNNIFVPAVLACAEAAVKNACPVSMGIGHTHSEVGINRRELDEKNGMKLGQNPWGCYDDLMTILAFRHEDNTPYFNIVHYGTHGTAAGMNTEVTRDWSGIMIDRMETETGAMTVFVQGAEGDVGPRLTNGETKGDISYVRELGAIAARDASCAYKGIEQYFEPTMDMAFGEIKIPLRSRISIEEAEAKIEEVLKKESGNMSTKQMAFYNRVIKSYEDGYCETKEKVHEQTIVNIGGVFLVPSPYELFSEMSLRMKKYAKTQRILVMCLTNGYDGYFPSMDQLERGGYEVETFEAHNIQQFVRDADNYYVHENLNLINKLRYYKHN